MCFAISLIKNDKSIWFKINFKMGLPKWLLCRQKDPAGALILWYSEFGTYTAS